MRFAALLLLTIFLDAVAPCLMVRAANVDDAGAARRERTNPILRPASTWPTARVTQLAFLGDEERSAKAGDAAARAPLKLFAAGEDKVVRVWSIARDTKGKATVSPAGQLLWPIYRDRVGAILAMSALGRDGRQFVAIGGIGAKTSQVNVIDVDNPDRVQVLLHPDVAQRRNQAVFAIDANAAGTQLAVGYDAEPDLGHPTARVLVWRLADATLLQTLDTGVSRARLVKFSPDGARIAVAGNLPLPGKGALVEIFDAAAGNREQRVEVKCDDAGTLASDYVVKGLLWLDDTHWQAATIAGVVDSAAAPTATFRPGFRHAPGEGGSSTTLTHRDPYAGTLKIRTTAGGAARIATLGVGKQVHVESGPLEIDAGGRWVAFPSGRAYETWPWMLAIAHDRASGRVLCGVRDVFRNRSRVVIDGEPGAAPIALDGNESLGWITAVALSPSGQYAAAASLESHGAEIRVWETATGKLVATMPDETVRMQCAMPVNHVRIAVGNAKPGVTRRETHLEFGVGAFDPSQIADAATFRFQLDYPRILEPIPANQATPAPQRWRKLTARACAPLVPRGSSLTPLCGIVFSTGKRQFVALGFPAGIEVRALELLPNTNKPNLSKPAPIVRKFYGHSAAVTALDVSPEGDWLLTGSIDGTLCGWSLRGLGDGSELGVSFAQMGDSVVVQKVVEFSPGWEAGFAVGQKIAAVMQAGNAIARTRWLETLRQPTPGAQLYVEAMQDGGRQAMISPVALDPLWTFYPQRDGNWILWTPQGYFDSSPDAASRFEWHVNLGGEATGARTFLAQDFREQYRKRPVIDAIVRTRDVALALAEAPSRPAPANVVLHIEGLQDGAAITTQTTAVSVAAATAGKSSLTGLQVWLNGRRLIDKASPNAKPAARLTTNVEIAPGELRPGSNMLVAVAVSDDDGTLLNSRRVLRFDYLAPTPSKPKLFYLGVGVTKLDSEPELKRLLDIGELKYAGADAKAIESALRKQLIASGQFDEGKLVTLAAGGAAAPNRAAILENLETIAATAKPQDFVVVMLAGHGFDEAPDPAGGDPRPGFFFVAQDTRPDLDQTAISGKVLSAALSKLRCASLLLLDACHAAAVRPQDEQLLDLGGLQLGPQIVTACRRLETSKEHDSLKHGLFTYSLLEALGAVSANAEIRRQCDDGRPGLSVDECCRYVKLRTPNLLAELTAGDKRGDAQRDSQNPEILSSLTFEPGRVLLAPEGAIAPGGAPAIGPASKPKTLPPKS
jgi:WD40 repeat protein